MPADVATIRQRGKMRAAGIAAFLGILSPCFPAAAAQFSLDPADQALDAGHVRRARELYVTVHLLAADAELAARAAEQAAWCDSLLGEYDEAASRLEILLRGLEGDGTRRGRLLNLLGEVRLNQAISLADRDLSRRSFAEAEQAFRDALAASSGMTGAEDPARYNLGRCLYHAERFDQARETLAPLAGRDDGSVLSTQAAILVLLADLRTALREPPDPTAIGRCLDRLHIAAAALEDRLLANEAMTVAATSLLASNRPGEALDWARRVLSREDLLASVGAAETRLRKALESAEATGSDADALRRDLQRLRIRHDELASLPDPRVHADIVAAESLLVLGETEESAAAFRRLLLRNDLAPAAAAQARAGMIRACAGLGDPEQAVSELEEVHELLGPDASAELAFAVGQTAIETRDLALAAETLDLCRRLSPAGPRAAAALYQEGALRLSLDEYARAANLLERFLDRTTHADARIADAWFRLGCARTALGEYESAAAAIERSLRMSGSGSEARRDGLLQLARLKILVDRPGEALAHLDELESGPAFPEGDLRNRSLILRADACEAMGLHEASADAWREISRHAASPLEAAAALWRAVIDLDAAGLGDPADEICRTIASSQVAGPHARAALQRLLRRAIAKGDPAGAAEILARTPPDRPEDLLDLARLWLDQGSRGILEIEDARRRAREAYERVAVEFSETSRAADALARLAALHEDSGNRDEAVRARARLLSAYPAHPEARKLGSSGHDTP